MANLKDTALMAKSRKDITDLDKIPVDVEVKEGTFKGKTGEMLSYHYFELNGWKYTVKADVMEKIKQVLTARPLTKFVKVVKTDNGQVIVLPID